MAQKTRKNSANKGQERHIKEVVRSTTMKAHKANGVLIGEKRSKGGNTVVIGGWKTKSGSEIWELDEDGTRRRIKTSKRSARAMTLATARYKSTLKRLAKQ